MKLDDKTIRLLASPKIRNLFTELCEKGGASHLIVGGKKIKASDLADHYGVKIKHADKYKEEKHADMGKTEVGRDTSELGDGDSQEQE